MSKRTATLVVLVAAVLGATAFAYFVMSPSTPQSDVVDEVATRQYLVPEAAATAEAGLAMFQEGDFFSHHGALALSDRSLVTPEEWSRRCQEIIEAAGALESYEVVETRYFTDDESIVEVLSEVKFEMLPAPVEVAEYYQLDGDEWQLTMLWGRSFSSEELR